MTGSGAFKWINALGSKLGNVLKRAEMIRQVQNGPGFTPGLAEFYIEGVQTLPVPGWMHLELKAKSYELQILD